MHGCMAFEQGIRVGRGSGVVGNSGILPYGAEVARGRDGVGWGGDSRSNEGQDPVDMVSSGVTVRTKPLPRRFHHLLLR